MPDDNFFNRSINDAAGATQSVDPAAASPVQITDGSVVVVSAVGAAGVRDFTLPLAVVGGTVTIVNQDAASVMTAIPGAGDNAVAGTGGGAVAVGEAATFVSDGVLTWTRIT